VAVYAVPLQELKRLRHGPPPSAGSSENNADPSAGLPEPATKPVDASATQGSSPSVRGSGEEVAFAASADQLMGLSRSQLAALLADPSESGNKVLLAMIYRLATIEQQLDELGSYIRGRSVQHSYPTPASAGQPVVGDTGKAEVLEQVFRKNLSLRGMGG